MEAVADVDVVRRKRYRRLSRPAATVTLVVLALAVVAFLYVEWKLRQPLPLPFVAPVDLWPRFFDLRPLEIVTTVSWRKIPMTVSRHRFLIDHTVWQRMHFEDWDRLPADVRAAGLDRLIARYGHLVAARRVWPGMTAHDWDEVPQPMRAMAFVSMIEGWIDFYAVGDVFDLERPEVRQTLKAIAMSESWFDHRAFAINSDGSVDIGLGGASGFARRTIRRWHEAGLCDFTLRDEDYFNPWLATRWLAFWFDVVLQEAGGDLDLAVRAYNWGIGRAAAGAGEEYLAAVERRLARYFEGPSHSPTWRRLSIFRRAQVRTLPPATNSVPTDSRPRPRLVQGGWRRRPPDSPRSPAHPRSSAPANPYER